jgi:hypothetical protein
MNMEVKNLSHWQIRAAEMFVLLIQDWSYLLKGLVDGER